MKPEHSWYISTVQKIQCSASLNKVHIIIRGEEIEFCW